MKTDLTAQVDSKKSESLPSPYRRPRTTIRFQLLIAVNTVLTVFVAFFLFFDYRRDLAERLEDKRIALEEEATTLLPAVLQIRHHGRDDVQQYLDDVCGQMRETHSPGHHIAVSFENDTLQAHSHHRASPEMLEAMRQAAISPRHRSSLGGSEIVVGTHEQSGTIVYVSETLENLYGSVIGGVMRRLTGFIALALVAGVVVNLVLSYVVTGPLSQLVKTVRTIGEGQFGVRANSFRSAELNYLTEEINAMSESLADAQRYRKAQMYKAREIQQNLLPKGIDSSIFNVAYLFQPADDVGGDYYDAMPLADGSWLFCIADVTGHGVSAAMSAAMLKALLMQAAEQFTSPASMLGFVNHWFTSVGLGSGFVTMLLVRLVPQTGVVEYAGAGHEPAWHLSLDGTLSELMSTGIPLGIEDDTKWGDTTIHLSEGHRLLLATDGVSETHNLQSEMFGRNRLATVFADCRQLPLGETAQRINESVKTFCKGKAQEDDVTVVLIEMAISKSK